MKQGAAGFPSDRCFGGRRDEGADHESDLVNYPGMYLYNEGDATTLSERFAPYPKTVEQGGHNMLQGIVKEREAKY